MTIKDLYRVLLRIMGIYFLVTVLISNVTGMYYQYLSDDSITQSMFSIVTLGIVFLVTYVLVVKTDNLIALLKLDERHDRTEVLTSGITGTNLFHFALVFIGLSLIIQNVIDLFTQIYYSLEHFIPNETPLMSRNFNLGNLISSSFSVLLGLFITLNASKLALWLNKKANQDE